MALVKSHGQWICCDDDQMIVITEAQVQSTFGQPQEGLAARAGAQAGSGVDHSYILMFQKRHDNGAGW